MYVYELSEIIFTKILHPRIVVGLNDASLRARARSAMEVPLESVFVVNGSGD
jgi:hypothetical protein